MLGWGSQLSVKSAPGCPRLQLQKVVLGYRTDHISPAPGLTQAADLPQNAFKCRRAFATY